MSLKDKWEEHRRIYMQEFPNATTFLIARLREAFYAGAEVADKTWDEEVTFGAGPEVKSMRIEIDHFKNKRAAD